MNQEVAKAEAGLHIALNECAEQSIKNFAGLAAPHRERCIKHLRRILHHERSVDAVLIWGAQVRCGDRIGSDDPRFHFSTGMQVRNALRDVMPDQDLPPVEQPSGDYASNWDDYYYGALHAAVTEEIG